MNNIHFYSITKMRENCLKEFDAHWQCLENNNQVRSYHSVSGPIPKLAILQEYYLCRKPERTLNKCMFEKLVRAVSLYHDDSPNCSPGFGKDDPLDSRRENTNSLSGETYLYINTKVDELDSPP